MAIVNKSALSGIVCVSEATLTEWQKLGLPMVYHAGRGGSNQYDTGQVIDWMIEREVSKLRDESPKDRLSRLQGDKVEIEIAEKLKELVPVSEIEPTWLAMVASAKSYLRSQPDRLVQLLEVTDGIEAKRDLLAESFDEILQKLSEYEPPESDDQEGGEDFPGAAEDVSSDMGGKVPLHIGRKQRATG